MVSAPVLTKDDERELRAFDSDETDKLKRQREAELDRLFPKPTEQDIQNLRQILDNEFRDYLVGEESGPDGEFRGRNGLQQVRDMRYQRDRLPAHYRDQLSGSQRFRSRLTHNEILRAVAMATRNEPKFTIDAAGTSATARKAAEKETRWANELFPALERKVNRPLRRIFADAEFEAGLAAWEVYLTRDFDKLDLDQHEDEDDRSYVKRTDEALRGAGLPFGARVIDPISLRYEEDEDDGGVRAAMIIERKRYKLVHERLQRRLSQAKIEELRLPKPGDHGWPVQSGEGSWTGNNSSGEVETIRYYDRRWYVYMVGGIIIDCEPHGFPGVPVIPAWGQTTSSSNISEQHQGITWGMLDMEQALNDLLTIDIDIAGTFSRPKAVIETDINGALRSTDGKPTTLDLRAKGVPELMPGQRIKNAFEGFESKVNPQTLGIVLDLWQRSGLNPVAQGESPGADPAGFTVNTLQAAAQMMYEILLDNYARSLGLLLDFIRQSIKHTIGDTVYLTVHGEEGAEFLGLGPEDITDVPSTTFIDPLNDVNRLAIRESLMAGNERGYVPRRHVQTHGFGAEDPDAWDEEIAEDLGYKALIGLALEQAKAIVFARQAASMMPPEAGGAGGTPPADNSAQAVEDAGGTPARVNPPSVGAGAETSGTTPQGRAGQQPARQGVPAGAPPGAN